MEYVALLMKAHRCGFNREHSCGRQQFNMEFSANRSGSSFNLVQL